MNALILVGAAASSKQFINKVKAAIPDMQLVADTTSVESGGQDDVKAHIDPNPYDGIITAEGRIGLEHSQDPELHVLQRHLQGARRASDLPLPNVVVKLAERQAEQHLRQRRGRLLVRDDVPGHRDAGRQEPERRELGRRRSNNFGSIQVMNTDWASLHAGKYDADDTYGLVQFDPRSPADRRVEAPHAHRGRQRES